MRRRDKLLVSVEGHIGGLHAHYYRNGTIPSMSGLARLWGYASKSSAARRVAQLIDLGILEWSADRRLRPGPEFHSTSPRPDPDDNDVAFEQEELLRDQFNNTAESWSRGYDPQLSQSYAMTVTLLRLARSIEIGVAQTAATEGLTSGEVLLLDALYRLPPPNQIAPTALKRHFSMSLPGIAKRVDRLTELGLVDRVPNPEDGRSLLVQLNDQGREVVGRMVELDRSNSHIVWPASLSAEEYQTVFNALRKAQTAIGRGDATNNENDRSH